MERFAQFGRFVKILKMFFEADNNAKGISSKYKSNFMVSSRLEAKITRITNVILHYSFICVLQSVSTNADCRPQVQNAD